MISVEHKVDRVLEHVREGGICIVVDDEGRENEGDFIAAADFATDETVNFMAKYGRGLICQAITEQRARELELPRMVLNNEDSMGTAFTVSVDAREVHTGISAAERALTIRRLADPSAKPEDLRRPGHMFPLIAREGGVLERRGHTEAARDLAGLAGCTPSGVICEILNDDGSMARMKDLEILAEQFGIPLISVQDLIEYRKQKEKSI
jgi:3,4-dihydroxy 2-butanone 4-phosphate synthase / GTP cyclohydrolase II